MRIWQIKCKRQFAGPGVYAYVAEAKVVVEEPDELFVTVHDYDGFLNYTVAKESIYAYLIDDEGGPVEDLLENYEEKAAAKKSAFADVFALLEKNIAALKKEYK